MRQHRRPPRLLGDIARPRRANRAGHKRFGPRPLARVLVPQDHSEGWNSQLSESGSASGPPPSTRPLLVIACRVVCVRSFHIGSAMDLVDHALPAGGLRIISPSGVQRQRSALCRRAKPHDLPSNRGTSACWLTTCLDEALNRAANPSRQLQRLPLRR